MPDINDDNLSPDATDSDAAETGDVTDTQPNDLTGTDADVTDSSTDEDETIAAISPLLPVVDDADADAVDEVELRLVGYGPDPGLGDRIKFNDGVSCSPAQLSSYGAKYIQAFRDWQRNRYEFETSEPGAIFGEIEPDLEDMTKAQLIEYGESIGIDVRNNDKKAEILQQIQDHLADA